MKVAVEGYFNLDEFLRENFLECGIGNFEF